MLFQARCVAIGGRAVLITGAPGSGKSSLALALIDRGGTLIGDDAVTLEQRDDRLYASPPPKITGMIEVRNVGLVECATVADVPVALAIVLDHDAPRFIDGATALRLGDCTVPQVTLWPDSPG